MTTLDHRPDDATLPNDAQFVDRHYAALYRFALSLARNPADAGDLTQQTFLVWSTKGQALRDKAKAKSWLFTTLYCQFLHGRRKANRLVALEDLPPGEQEIPEVEVDMAAKMDAQLVLAALQEVDLAFRGPLTLFYLQDHSYRETADILGVPIGTVMSRLHRGKSQLRAILAQKTRFPEAA